MSRNVIVGLGVSGLACAFELAARGSSFIAFEKEDRAGGLAKTDVIDGFHFDWGPHIILNVQPETKRFLDHFPALKLAECTGHSFVTTGEGINRLVPGIFQHNLNCLTLNERIRILCDLLFTYNPNPPINYRDYVINRCGKRIYTLFFEPYETKRLRFNLDAMPPDWTRRIPPPSILSLLTPKRSIFNSGQGYGEAHFQYPTSGGIEALPKAILSSLPKDSIRYNSKLIQIDLTAKSALFEGSPPVHYDNLVLTLPLPEIVRALKDPPDIVIQAATNLIHTAIYIISIGIEGSLQPCSFLRFPTSGVEFYRLSFPCAFAKSVAPQGASVISAEISHHHARFPLSSGEALAHTKKVLSDLGIIGPHHKVLIEQTRNIEYGHIVYTNETTRSVRCILDYLRAHSVHTCGKYGLWTDMLMTDSISSGRSIARTITKNGIQ